MNAKRTRELKQGRNNRSPLQMSPGKALDFSELPSDGKLSRDPIVLDRVKKAESMIGDLS